MDEDRFREVVNRGVGAFLVIFSAPRLVKTGGAAAGAELLFLVLDRGGEKLGVGAFLAVLVLRDAGTGGGPETCLLLVEVVRTCGFG